jgi:hypothetical protein
MRTPLLASVELARLSVSDERSLTRSRELQMKPKPFIAIQQHLRYPQEPFSQDKEKKQFACGCDCT